MAMQHGERPHSQHGPQGGRGKERTHYRHLLLMAGLSFIAMYFLMYAMVDAMANVYTNFNQMYMAGLMTAPMVLIELGVMRMMYEDRRLNLIVAALSVVLLVGCWTMVRLQTGISDTQFLRSMIPHHASALLMCRQAPVQDPEIKELCKAILTGQQSEIELMKTKLRQLDR